MDLPNEIRRVFKIISCLVAEIILCLNFLHLPSLFADDNLKQSVQSGAVVIEQKTSQPLKSADLGNINMNQESIDLRKIVKGTGLSRIQATTKNPSKNISHSGISLRSGMSGVLQPSKEKPTSRWIIGKISKPASSELFVMASQSKELQNLKKQRENRKSSFEQSLETSSGSRNSLLLKQPNGNHGSEKGNE